MINPSSCISYALLGDLLTFGLVRELPYDRAQFLRSYDFFELFLASSITSTFSSLKSLVAFMFIALKISLAVFIVLENKNSIDSSSMLFYHT
jgi:hypothetical protein